MGFEDRKTWHFFWSIAMFCNFVLCFFLGGGGGYPLKWFLRLEIFDPENDWGKDSKPQIWTCFFESDGWFDCKVLTQQCWPEFLDVPNVHKGNHIFCCFGGFGKCLGYINVIVAIDLSIPLQTNTPKTKWALYRLHTVDSTIFTQNHFEYIFCWGGKNRNPSSNPFLKQTKVFPGSTQGWWTQRWGRRKRPCGRGLCALAGTHGAAAFRGTADLTTAFHWNPGRANPPVDEMRRVAAAFFFPPWSECFPPKDK